MQFKFIAIAHDLRSQHLVFLFLVNTWKNLKLTEL